MGFEVVLPGILTTVQDLGRRGYAAEGYPECGACDKAAFQAANLAVGNPAGAAALEFTVLGPELLFDAAAVAAVCGPGVSPLVNGAPAPAWRPILLRPGDTLNVAPLTEGMRGYIALRGGVDADEVMGSRSTDIRSGIGGWHGRPLRRGDRLETPCRDAEARWEGIARLAGRLALAHPLTPDYSRSPRVRAVPGPHEHRFTEAGKRTFAENFYAVEPESNRMGLRLSGRAVEMTDGADVLSDGVLEGSVQISANGQPIVMLADHQTTGGYARIATVIPPDIPLLAQLRPGDTAAFEYVTVREALRANRAWSAQFEAWDEAMREEGYVQGGSQLGPGRKLRRLFHRQ